MRRLDRQQKDFLAAFIEKLALMIAGALVIGQFVPGVQTNWIIAALGITFTILAGLYAVRLKKKTEENSHENLT